MSFNIEDDNVYLSYSELWNKIKEASNIRTKVPKLHKN